MCGLVLRLSDNNPSILKRIRIQRPFSDRACGLLRMYSFYMQGDDECSLSNVAEWENCGKSHTLAPMVTGSAVIGVKYDGGVLIAADTLGSYGSMAKIRNVSRLQCVNDEVGFSINDCSAFINYPSTRKQNDNSMTSRSKTCHVLPKIDESLSRLGKAK